MTNLTTRNKRAAVLLMAAVFALLMLSGLTASADEARNLTITAGVPETMDINNKNCTKQATILSASTDNAAIVTVTYNSANFTLSGVQAGTAKVTIRVRDNSDNSEYNWILTITVQGTSSAYPRAISIPVGASATLDNFSSVASINSSVSTVATASQNGTAVIATGHSLGSTTITITGVLSGGSTQMSYTYNISVTSGSGGGTATNSSSVTLKAGQNAMIGQGGTYSAITAYNSNNTTVATVSVSNNVLTIAGRSSGSATVTFTATTAATGASVTYTIYVTVRGTSSSTGNIEVVGNQNCDGEGLTIGVAERLVAEGKTYRLRGISMNGTPIAANELLWLSTDDSIVTINKTTGIFKAKKTGTTRLIAVDTLGRYHLTVAITVQ